MFKEKLYNDILCRWLEIESRFFSGFEKVSPPSFESLRQLIDEAFKASLGREEGRPLRFAVCLLAKNRLDEINALRKQNQMLEAQVVQVFENSILFTSRNLAKLAGAFDPSLSALLVSPSEESGGGLNIWGAMHYGRQEIQFFSLGQGSPFSLGLPDALICTARSAGSLMLARGQIHVGGIILGEFIPGQATPFIRGAIGSYISKLFANYYPPNEIEDFLHQVYIWSLIQLLNEISNRSRGSSILLIPNHQTNLAFKKSEAKYGFSGKFNMLKIMEMSRKVGSGFPEHEYPLIVNKAYIRDLRERLSSIAQLANVDGALLLSPELEPLSFATKLKASNKWAGDIIYGPTYENSGGEKFDISIYGTRHNSVLSFIAEVEGAIGFVVSADGPIRCFVKRDAATILCWPDCRQSVRTWEIAAEPFQ